MEYVQGCETIIDIEISTLSGLKITGDDIIYLNYSGSAIRNKTFIAPSNIIMRDRESSAPLKITTIDHPETDEYIIIEATSSRNIEYNIYTIYILSIENYREQDCLEYNYEFNRYREDSCMMNGYFWNPYWHETRIANIIEPKE